MGRKHLEVMLLLALGLAVLAPACGSGKFGGGSGGDGGDDGSFVTNDGSFTFGDASGDSAHPPPPGSDASYTSVTPCDLCALAGGQCVSNVCTIVDNPANVSQATQTQLQAGGSADTAFKWLYPYDQTVFARGLPSPMMQLAGTVASYAYVHISCSTLDYKGFFVPSAGKLGGSAFALGSAAWTAVAAAVQSTKDPMHVEVTKMSSGAVTGPISETWTMAQGALRGSIYYETYGSQLLGGPLSVGIMRLQPGAAQPTIVKKGCGNVCHTASADGSTLVANGAMVGLSSASYDLKNNATLLKGMGNLEFTYGGIYPDGSFVMSATNYRTWTGMASSLYDTKTGAKIQALGWDNVITKGGTTAFSPDGKKIAFIHEDKDGGHTLSVADFNDATKTFSNITDVATDASNYLAWPAFTPDSRFVVYHAGTSAVFETDLDQNTSAVTKGDLFAVDLATHTVVRLSAADGYTASSGTTSYLPAGDPNLSFAPTVLPEAVGGYYWVIFTSHRSWGNTLPSLDNNDQNGKLWIAAYDMNTAAGTDGSHPAVFLQGQELMSDNLRGFWVLDPCKPQGASCASGDECCQGFCRSDDGGAPTCVVPPGGCSNEYELCTKAADCCNTADQCINGRCAIVPN